MIKTITIDNLSDMKALAKSLANHVFPGFTLGLEGDLGAGKTTFTQFFGEALGVKEHINSPTFTIMKHYQGRVFLSHVDAYRLEGAYSDPNIEEYIYADGVSVIEWYPYIIDSMPDSFMKMHIRFVKDTQRIVTLEGSDLYETIINKLGY
jgi:tRNA threonylcarbamoyladenosine biosynthesis protein TsaE